MKRVNCVDAVSPELVFGKRYEIEEEYTTPDGDTWCVLKGGAHYRRARFVDVVDPINIDCAYDETPTVPDRPLPRINDEVFDFDHYNSLGALPGTRR